MAMTSHMTLLPVTIIRKVCICTVFLFLLLLLHLNYSLVGQEDRVQNLLSRLSLSSPSHSPSPSTPEGSKSQSLENRSPLSRRFVNHHQHHNHHRYPSSSSSSSSASLQQVQRDQPFPHQLPPPFRLIHDSISNHSEDDDANLLIQLYQSYPQSNDYNNNNYYNYNNNNNNNKNDNYININNNNNTKATIPFVNTDSNFNCILSKSEPAFTICVYKTSVDRFISGALLSSGIWEPFITSAFQTALSEHPDAAVIDIGANIGYYSLLASSRSHDVIAVEPYGENRRRLVAGSILTTRQYDEGEATGAAAAGRVLLLGNAMSDGHRLVGLSKSGDNQGALRVLEDCQNDTKGILGFFRSLYSSSHHARGDVEPARSCDIPTLTLDDLLLVLNANKAIIKVDIEGYECRAMGQASKLFASVQVPYIFTEWRLMRERQRDPDTACPAHRIRHLALTLADLGFVPHEVQSGIRLNPNSAPQWQVGDVYWRQKDQPLLVPSM